MRHKRNKTATMIAAGVAAVIVGVILRGAAPQLYRYVRIRRM